MRQQKGFTLIELLVVIAIIGILSTLAVISLNNAREKSRDAKRISDIKQIQTALELYYNDNGGYPTTLIMTGGGSLVSGSVTYMGSVPSNPLPAGDTDPYSYTAYTTTSYSIGFGLEGATGGLSAGDHTATPSGIN